MAERHNFQIAAGSAILSLLIDEVISFGVFRVASDLVNFAFNSQIDRRTLTFISRIDWRHAAADEHPIAERARASIASTSLDLALSSLRIRKFDELKLLTAYSLFVSLLTATRSP
jgi:hypothetical protein